MALYETVFIARQDLTVDDVDNLSEKLEKIITDGKGKIVSKEYWGLRNLTYKIKKNSILFIFTVLTEMTHKKI